MATKVVGIIDATTQLVLMALMFITGFKYHLTYNIWVEEEEKYSSVIGFVLVFVVIVVMAVIIIILNARRKRTQEPKSRAQVIRKFSISDIITKSIGFFVFSFLSEEMVAAIGFEVFSMDLLESVYLGGFYGSVQGYIIAMNLLGVAFAIITLCVTKDEEPVAEEVSTYGPPIIINKSAKQPEPQVIGTKICRHCGFEQAANRKVCWKCAQKFEE